MVSLVTILGLGLAFFPRSTLCDSKFIRPPEVDGEKQYDFDFQNNRRYIVGDKVQILWESDLDNTELWLVQTTGPIKSDHWSLLDATRTEWEAEYDIREMSEGEDSVYFFAIKAGEIVAQSQFFNVSTPKPEETQTRTVVQITTVIPEESSATQTTAVPTAEPSTTAIRTSEDTSTSSDSGLSRGETAGAAAGAVIGALLIFGGLGWLLWKKVARHKEDHSISEGSQVQQQQLQFSEPKAELPGDHGQQVSDFARSSTGIYEAP